MYFEEQQLLSLTALFVWPLLRIGAMFISVPVLSGQSVPLRVRLILSVAITFIVMPLIPQPPASLMFSYQGGLIAVQQVFIGLFTGFFLQLVFAAVIFGGQSIAYSMGLGFASMVDPQTGVQVPVVAQFYALLATLVFLATNSHLVLIRLLVDSFHTIPLSEEGIGRSGIWALLMWGGRVFTGGVRLALPVIFGLLLVNIGFGVATRAAPQLNIFAVGFAVTILLGLWFIWLTLPVVLHNFSILTTDALIMVGQLLAE